MIHAQGLSHRYPGQPQPSLHEVTLSVARGRITGLLGPNGAGKTTLISLLAGVLPLQQGELQIDGRDARRQLREIRACSALVPQDFAFYPQLSVAENLHFFARIRGLSASARRSGVAFAIEVCGLGEVLERRAERLSGGVRRRLNLAIGLLNRPPLLFLDEPTVGIDAQSRSFILERIRGLRAEGMTVVYTSHYMEEIELICDAIAIIDHGRILQHGALDALHADADDKPLELELPAASLPLADALLESLPACRPLPQGLRFDAVSSTQLIAILAHLEAAGVAPRSCRYGADALEQRYLALTRRELRDA